MVRNKRLVLTIAVFTLFLLSLSAQMIKPTDAQTPEAATTSTQGPVHVQVGVWLNNVEKIDLVGNSYRLDFYIWFKFDPAQISLSK
jgi:hypothetical protein